MPYKVFPIPSSNYYKVKNTETGEVKAKRTTLKRANAQVRLLEGLEHGTVKPRRKLKTKRANWNSRVTGVRTFPNLMSVR